MRIESVLIANRGEIALRVMRTASRLGLRTVAVHTDLDADAPHVRAADEAVPVPSYLDIEAVVAAALATGADAVHPGYGFLSERAEFAAALEAAGITLVGPSAAVMEQMGRKDAARRIALAAGVPVVPDGEDARRDWTGPVLVKAAAGGGGKGMRVVRSADELDEAVAAAEREASSAFGDDTVLIERYVERGRHIEVQVIGDTAGTVLHLGERDCSPQRRHQKVLEEAPAPTISEAIRERVTSAAVALATHVGYLNAGTVEFLLDPEADGGAGEVYFLEMNTRLQVEHPVTEAVVRVAGAPLDLVELQLRVAAGEPLGIGQDDVRVEGHAIEARVYAEDPYRGFLPQAGTARRVRWPDGVRVDAALADGQTVGTAYDPMLGKVIAHGPDRESARLSLIDALDRTVILGLTTNAGFLRALLATDEFRDAAIDTAWLDRHELPAPDRELPRRIAAAELAGRRGVEAGPFRADGFRLGGPPAPIRIPLDGRLVEVRPLPAGVAEHATVTLAGPLDHARVEVAYRGQRFVFAPPDRVAGGAAAGDGSITAPMPGTVLEVRVEPGTAVVEGEVLGVLEAMKMELSLTAPFAGTVTRLGARAGAQVALGAELFVVAPAEGAET
ncbi:MAG: biotin carboxylase N-terminal domain-containing protein [Nocardioides sp.]|uniref:ATP-binding protein n=1 Tax=Nocardioides sp. TaxID=35761 RepID=UPI0039E6CBAB